MGVEFGNLVVDAHHRDLKAEAEVADDDSEHMLSMTTGLLSPSLPLHSPSPPPLSGSVQLHVNIMEGAIAAKCDETNKHTDFVTDCTGGHITIKSSNGAEKTYVWVQYIMKNNLVRRSTFPFFVLLILFFFSSLRLDTPFHAEN
jgi:hypothetical protein